MRFGIERASTEPESLLLLPSPEQALKRAKPIKAATTKPVTPFFEKHIDILPADVDRYRAAKRRNKACIIFKPPVRF
jgi:hypothetical protein